MNNIDIPSVTTSAPQAVVEVTRESLPKPVLVATDMPTKLREICYDHALDALIAHKIEKDQATYIKRALEQYNSALWHVIVGTHFGASVSHAVNGYLIFSIGKVHIMCFMSFDESSLVDGKRDDHVTRGIDPKQEEEVREY